MITLIQKCDKCGESWDASKENAEQLWEVGITFACHPVRSEYRSAPTEDRQTDWCRPCMVKAGLLGTEKEKKALPPEHKCPTLEELIVEIARNS